MYLYLGSPRCIELCPNQQKGQASGSWKFGNIIQILFVEIKKSRPSGDFFLFSETLATLDLILINWRKTFQKSWAFQVLKRERTTEGGELLLAVAFQQSSWKLRTPSYANALRVFQIHPDHGKSFGTTTT